MNDELEHGPHSCQPVALVGGGGEPEVADAFEVFFAQWRLFVAKMGVRGSDNGDMMALADPFASHVVGTKFHAILGGAGIVGDEEDVHLLIES